MNSLVGIFTSLEEMKKNPRPINYVMGRDGIYEIRHNGVGFFSKKVTEEIEELERVEEGFTPSLPKIPLEILMEIIDAFKKAQPKEKVAQVFWNKQTKKHFVKYPHQKGDRYAVTFQRDVPENCILVLEMHSHPGDFAQFSPVDDRDEIATGLYGIVAGLHRERPKIRLRMSCNGYYKPLKLGEVFELGDYQCG
ncbi:MAG: Mov34/MPN/PAD-1 family protein [Thermosipho sp. (in: Bacteria)]|nr:Mov34/MPN/PAD-1 family protein [Thermosipho sp. (in: thermotogales)]